MVVAVVAIVFVISFISVCCVSIDDSCADTDVAVLFGVASDSSDLVESVDIVVVVFLLIFPLT